MRDGRDAEIIRFDGTDLALENVCERSNGWRYKHVVSDFPLKLALHVTVHSKSKGNRCLFIKVTDCFINLFNNPFITHHFFVDFICSLKLID